MVRGKRGGRRGEDQWEDDGDWEEEISAPTERPPQLPLGWVCHIEWQQHGKFKVWYTTDDHTHLKSKREMRDYLKMRQDIDSKILLKEADFSQNYAKRVVLLQHRQEKARAHEGKQQSQAAAGPSQQARTEADERALESILKDGGQLNFRTAGSGSGIVCVPEGEEGGAEGNVEGAAIGPAVNCYDSDLALARAMQQEENRRAGLHSGRWGLSEDGSYEDDDPEDYSDDSEDNFGEVAAGGWRVRANQQAEDVANDEDVSCLEVKKFAAGDEGGHCPVCQETWAIGDEQRVLPCGHGFHPVCVDRWLKSHNAKCPLCKKDIREDWEDEDEEVWDPVTGKWVREDGFSGEERSEGESGEDRSTNHVDT